MTNRIFIPCLVLLLLTLPGICRAAETHSAPLRIRMLFANQQACIVLNDNPAAKELVSMLPLTMQFEDFNHIEKIGYLPRQLHTQGAPLSCDPMTGTFAYYAPWGNLSIFYRDFRHSDGLVPLGHVESGMDKLAQMQGDFAVLLEKME